MWTKHAKITSIKEDTTAIKEDTTAIRNSIGELPTKKDMSDMNDAQATNIVNQLKETIKTEAKQAAEKEHAGQTQNIVEQMNASLDARVGAFAARGREHRDHRQSRASPTATGEALP